MSDLIDRQAAIKAVCERECQELKPCIGECEAIWALEDLPTAEKRGRWINMDGHVLCSSCGASHYGVDKNYCPNCGAKMEESE